MAVQEQSKNSEIVLACIDDNYFKDEIVLEHHSLVRIVSGEMKVVQADNSYIFVPGDTLLFPRRQLATLIKYPKDGRPYQSVVMTLTRERLTDYYARNRFSITKPYDHKIKTLAKAPLLDSFFASLLPLFSDGRGIATQNG